MMNQMKLNKKELKIIEWACRIPDAILDFDNNDDEQFEKQYGMTKREAYVTCEKLMQKVDLEQEKYSTT
jgi:hypothetical protein